MRKLFTLFLSATMLAAAPVSAAVIYSEDFEDGVFNGATQGFMIPGGLGGGSSLFHVTENFPASGSRALGFVTGETPGGTPNGTFAGAPTGTIYTPEIVLPNTGTISLNFDVANFGRGNTFFDRFDIGVFVGGQHYVKASTFPGYSGLGAQIYPQDNGYNSLTSIISDLAGQTVRVYIHYSVISPTNGNFAGGRIDNLSVSDNTAVPEPGMIGLLGAGLAGITFARRRKL